MIRPRLFALLLAVGVAALASGCARHAPLDPDFSATAVRYVPADTPDGIAELVGIQRATIQARKQLRNHLMANPALSGLPEDLLLASIRDDFLRAKTDELIRQAEIVSTEFSRDERRAEATIAIDPEKFRSELRAAYDARRGGTL